MNDPADLATLAGAYRLHPGRRPAITGARPVLEGRLAGLLRGQVAERAAQVCGAVFTLCAQAHRRVAEAAVAAAKGEEVPGEPGALAVETARDHLRAVAVDWPTRAGVAPDPAWLRNAGLSHRREATRRTAAVDRFAQRQPTEDPLARLRGWLEQEVLREPASDWLARCAEPQALRAWCERNAATCPPARCLAQWHDAAQRIGIPCEPLAIDAESDLRELAAAIAGDVQFAQWPHWRGEARENGPWTRQREGSMPLTAWLRLAARWRELVALAAAAGAPDGALRSGALRTGTGEAIAWCEMARGLLFHWVRLDAGGRVADYRVLAPTEWNFHPQGALARALQALPPGDTATATLLAAAFDPCVPCTVAAP